MTDQELDPSLEKWTDDQESALLRAIINWKPVGMHKHFRMLSIRDYMFSAGIINPEDEHTSISGLWKKLNSLYNLDKLDEREDSVMGDGVDDKGNTVPYWREFELPRDDFEEKMWDRRLAPEGTSSPEMSRRESTVADTDEPRSSPASNQAAGRRGRGKARKSGRLSKLQNELDTEKSSTRASKAGSAADEDQHMDDVEAEEEAGESGEGEEETEEEDEDEEEKKATTKRGGRGAKRGRGARRGRRRG